MQEDKYGENGNGAKEIGIRLKAAEYLKKDTLPLLGKAVAVKAYIGADAKNTALQFIVQDSEFQQAMGPAQELRPGEWTTVYFKLLDKSQSEKYPGKNPEFIGCDVSGTKKEAGAYTSDTFKQDGITEFEIRSVGNKNSAGGDQVIVWIESIEWADIDINANLKSLSLSDGTLTPAFSPTVTAYSARLPKDATAFTVSGEVDAPGGTVAFNPAQPVSINTQTAFPLTITATVTAKDGKTKKAYTITVTKESDVTEPGILDPAQFMVWYGATIADKVISFTNGGVYYEWPKGFNKEDYDTFTIEYEVISAVSDTSKRKIALKSWKAGETGGYTDFAYPEFGSPTGSITLKNGQEWYGTADASKTLYTDLFTKQAGAIGFAVTNNTKNADNTDASWDLKIVSMKFSKSN